jgi:glycosyltransferase involved in cell wall biosynthesis
VVVAPLDATAVVARAVVAVGSALAVGIAAHTIVNLRHLRRPQPQSPDVNEKVSVLIPARNEEQHVAHTVHSALMQMGVTHLTVTVLDDGSTDGTAAALEQIEDDRLTVVRAPNDAPPPGWLGKPWACQRLSEMADGDVLVFLDADVFLEPSAIRAGIDTLRTNRFALVAPYPRQLAVTWLERLVQPLVTWSWVATMPLGWAERSLRPSLSAANGQLLFFDAAAYRSIGGHRAVADEVLEDIALMRALKRAGFNTATVDGSHMASCRMYSGTRDVVDGYTKSLWDAFNGPVGSLGANALLLLSGTVPYLALVLGRRRSTRVIGAVGYAAGVVSRFAVAARTGERRIPDAFAHPKSIAAFTVLNAMSWWRHINGSNTWKGRPVTTAVESR